MEVEGKARVIRDSVCGRPQRAIMGQSSPPPLSAMRRGLDLALCLSAFVIYMYT